MEKPTVTPIQEKVRAYLTKITPVVEERDWMTVYKENLKPKPKKTATESIIDLFTNMIYVKKDYEYALYFLQYSNGFHDNVHRKAEFMYFNAVCYLALFDFEAAMHSITICISYNSSDPDKTNERTAQIHGLREIAEEGYQLKHPSKHKEDRTFCES